MSDDDHSQKPEVVEEGIKDMKIEGEDSSSDEEVYGTIRVEEVNPLPAHIDKTESPLKMELKSATQSPKKGCSASHSPTKAKGEHEQIIGGEITLKLEPGQPPKLARTASHKVTARPVQMFDDYPDKTEEATGVFQVITQCSYSAKYLGTTEHAMECDCAEEWGKIQCSSQMSHPAISNRFVTDTIIQMLRPRPIMLVETIPIVSTAPPKWSASGIAAAEQTARTNASNDKNMPKSQSSRPRRKATVYELMLTYTLMTSFSSILAKSLMRANSAAACISMTMKVSNIFTSCPLAKASLSMRPKKGTLGGSAIIHAIPTVTWINGWWVTNFGWAFLPSGKSKPAKNWSSTTMSTDMAPTHNHAIAVSQTAQDLLVARLKLSVRPNCQILPLKP